MYLYSIYNESKITNKGINMLLTINIITFSNPLAGALFWFGCGWLFAGIIGLVDRLSRPNCNCES